MKRFFAAIIDICSLPFALVCNAKVSFLWDVIKGRVYSNIIQRRFKRAKGLRVIGSPVMITGANHISLGDNVEICRLARIDAIDCYPNTGQHFAPRLKIANNVVVQISCHIGCINRVEIGEYTTMGARTYITDHTHGSVEYGDLQLPPRHRNLYSKGPVIIGKYVSIGEGCVILPGVTIGDHAVIGANAVVTKDIPPYAVAVGNPARVVKQVMEN